MLFLKSKYLPKDLLKMLPVQLSPTIFSETFRGLLRRDVPLRLRHQLITHQELPNRCTAEQRRVEVHMEM